MPTLRDRHGDARSCAGRPPGSRINSGCAPAAAGISGQPTRPRLLPGRPESARNRPEKADSGVTPNPRGFLDFPIGSPYTGPAFKLSVRRPIGLAPRERGSRQVAGASGSSRAAPPALIPAHSLSEAPEMISGVRLSEDTGMPTGTIARLLIDKGFGFIRDEGGNRAFLPSQLGARRGVRAAARRSARRIHAGRIRQRAARRRSPPHRKLMPTPCTHPAGGATAPRQTGSRSQPKTICVSPACRSSPPNSRERLLDCRPKLPRMQR